MPAVYEDILAAVVTQTRAIGLDGIDDDSIGRMKVANDDEQQLPGLPAVVIAPFGAPRIDPRAGTNAQDIIEYPVLVVTIDAGNQRHGAAETARHLLWHQNIRRQFIHKPLSGVSVVSTCFVDPRDTYDTGAFFANLDAGGMILRFQACEQRTLV